MASRLNAQEERLATLRSVMNVIAILDHSAPERARPNHGFDLRPLLPPLQSEGVDESWDDYLFPARQLSGSRRPRTR